MSSLRRLAKDHACLRSSLPPNYLFASEADSFPDDLTQLVICLTGSDGTPYSRGLWTLHLRMPADYPKSPPKATFQTRIFHPNVEENTGAVCLETLKRDWDPKLTLKDILITISCLLIQPNPDSALNEKAGVLVREDYAGFERQAKLMTRIHASIPEHLKELVGQARRRGDEQPETGDEERASKLSVARADHDEGADSSKENDPSRTTHKHDNVKKHALGKRPFTEIPTTDVGDDDVVKDVDEGKPLRKSPKHTHPLPEAVIETTSKECEKPGTQDLVQVKSRRESLAPVSSRPQLRTISSGSSGKLRAQARIGIRRL